MVLRRSAGTARRGIFQPGSRPRMSISVLCKVERTAPARNIVTIPSAPPVSTTTKKVGTTSDAPTSEAIAVKKTEEERGPVGARQAQGADGREKLHVARAHRAEDVEDEHQPEGQRAAAETGQSAPSPAAERVDDQPGQQRRQHEKVRDGPVAPVVISDDERQRQQEGEGDDGGVADHFSVLN